jgi:hypothetical protein
MLAEEAPVCCGDGDGTSRVPCGHIKGKGCWARVRVSGFRFQVSDFRFRVRASGLGVRGRALGVGV